MLKRLGHILLGSRSVPEGGTGEGIPSTGSGAPIAQHDKDSSSPKSKPFHYEPDLAHSNADNHSIQALSGINTDCTAIPVDCVENGVEIDTMASLEQDTICDLPADIVSIERACSGDITVGQRFANLTEARSACEKFAQCTIVQKSQKNHKFVIFSCFRSGCYIKRASSVPEELQRKKKTNKCDCKFVIKLKAVDETGFEIYDLHTVHNHELFEEAELSALGINRFIPDEVKARMLELNKCGVLNSSQIMTLIEDEFDVPVTWNKRDMHNLFSSVRNTQSESNEFAALLNKKVSTGWKTFVKLNEDTFRLERIFWISPKGIECYSYFHDVIEVDATYKTNRYEFLYLLTV